MAPEKEAQIPLFKIGQSSSFFVAKSEPNRGTTAVRINISNWSFDA